MLEAAAGFMPHLFPLVGTAFSVLFILLLGIILLKGIAKIDAGELFTSAGDGGTSVTKFWQNIAYAAATVAFLSVNIMGKVEGASLEIIWVIYLAVIGGSAALSKWISVKYNRTEETRSRDGGYTIRRPAQRTRRDADSADASYSVKPDSPD